VHYIIEDGPDNQNVSLQRVQYGIWDHQTQKLISRYVRPIDADYKRVETKFPRLFNQLNHATTALNQLLAIEPDAYARYEVVEINVSYEMIVSKTGSSRNEKLIRNRALSKLSKEEKLALGISV
jgi:hypothetical protein